MGILDTAKDAVQLVQKIDNIELYKQILDLQSEAIKLVEENISLKNQNRALQEQLKVKDSLTFENNGYWIQKENTKEGPFCTHCWDKNKELVRKHLDDTERWFCLTHEKPRYPSFVA